MKLFRVQIVMTDPNKIGLSLIGIVMSITADDCDDNDPTTVNDMDCDGVLTADDCDDNDPNTVLDMTVMVFTSISTVMTVMSLALSLTIKIVMV